MILSYNAPRIYSKTCGCYASQEGFFFCPLHAAAPLLLEGCRAALHYINVSSAEQNINANVLQVALYAAIAAATKEVK